MQYGYNYVKTRLNLPILDTTYVFKKKEKTQNKKLQQLTLNTVKQVKGALFQGDIDTFIKSRLLKQ